LDRLSLPNPAFLAWEKHGKGPMPVGRITCATVQDGGPWTGGYIIPRHAPGVVGADRMAMPEAAPLTFTGEARDYQRAAIHAVLDTRLRDGSRGFGGMIQAPCGAGKTFMGCALMAELATPALVLVHTKDLADQWVDQVRRFLGVEAALIGYGKTIDKYTPSRVTVASLQTLAKLSWWEMHQLGQQWGLVIADEVHHIPAQSFAQVIAGLPARWRVGLTATPNRVDGLTPWLGWIIGPTVARINPSVLERAGRVVAPTILRIDAPEIELDGLEAHERDREIAEDDARNELLVETCQSAVKAGRRVLVLVKLVDHAHLLAQMLRDAGLDSAALVGEVAKRERTETIDRMRAGTVEVVVATSLADEGLDAPRLDTCVLAVPSGHMGRVEQRIGRVCRPHPEAKTPLVVDVVDPWGPYQGYARRRMGLYRSRGWV